MEIINQFIVFLSKLLEWWVLVMPWEQAIFVRSGKKSRLLKEGLYFKIPFIDTVYIQTVRMRMVDLPMQTASTKDGKTVTVKMAVGYSIGDMEKLYNTIYHPEITLGSKAMGLSAKFICENNELDVSPKSIEQHVMSELNKSDWGLKDITISVTSQVSVRTFRLIQDASWLGEGLLMEPKK